MADSYKTFGPIACTDTQYRKFLSAWVAKAQNMSLLEFDNTNQTLTISIAGKDITQDTMIVYALAGEKINKDPITERISTAGSKLITATDTKVTTLTDPKLDISNATDLVDAKVGK